MTINIERKTAMPIIVLGKLDQLYIDNLDDMINETLKRITAESIDKQMDIIQSVIDSRSVEATHAFEKEESDVRITI